jgi:hypothetical protein
MRTDPSRTHEVRFVASGRGKAQCAPDPDYPHGVEVKMDQKSLKRFGAPSKPCVVKLPYPAPECGWWDVTCGLTMAITATGRVDDPVSAELPCLPMGQGGGVQ